MKSKNHIILWVFGMLVAMTVLACKPKSVFLHAERVRMDTLNYDLGQIQFYNDKDIVLRHKQSEGGFVSEMGGKMIEVDGEAIYQVVIKKGTPCLVTGEQNDKLLVRFEPGDKRFLIFYKNSKGAYQIDALKWVKRYGMIKYAGLDFTIEPESNDVLLMYRQKSSFKSISSSRTIKGLRVEP
ncbi:MAG: hypothetical protein RLZZ165_1752 [Bacteroidota bacterium]|jgi:hypothetical protein